MNDDSLPLPSPADLFHTNPAAVIFTVAFVLIFFCTRYFYVTVIMRRRVPSRRKSFQSVRDAVDYSKRVKKFFQLVADERAGKPKPVPPYKPLTAGLPPRRDDPAPASPVVAKDESPKP